MLWLSVNITRDQMSTAQVTSPQQRLQQALHDTFDTSQLYSSKLLAGMLLSVADFFVMVAQVTQTDVQRASFFSLSTSPVATWYITVQVTECTAFCCVCEHESNTRPGSCVLAAHGDDCMETIAMSSHPILA